MHLNPVHPAIKQQSRRPFKLKKSAVKVIVLAPIDVLSYARKFEIFRGEAIMKKLIAALAAMVLLFAVVSADAAVKSGGKKGGKAKAVKAVKVKKKGVKDMTTEELIKTALGGAPEHISKDASVMAHGPEGKLVEVKKGKNGFTCLPDMSGQEDPDPVCADEAGFAWITDMMDKATKPRNERPGIAYMAKGGWHWEKDDRIVDATMPGARRVKEPPHWMVFWPFGAKESMLPPYPDRFGAYIMYEGTPYAHLMIYQDPARLGLSTRRPDTAPKRP